MANDPRNDLRVTNIVPPVKRPCRPRASRLESLLNSQSFPQIVPPDPTHLDDALEYLCARDPATDEVIVSTMELMSVSRRASVVIQVTNDKLQAAFRKFITATTFREPTEEEKTQAITEAKSAMELLMSMGFLAGTAIGFAAGLEIEEDDGDGDDDPFESPMI
jgi:hypothetical protein